LTVVQLTVGLGMQERPEAGRLPKTVHRRTSAYGAATVCVTLLD
jgi:hypothetical protein